MSTAGMVVSAALLLFMALIIGRRKGLRVDSMEPHDIRLMVPDFLDVLTRHLPSTPQISYGKVGYRFCV